MTADPAEQARSGTAPPNGASSLPPFPLDRPTSASWREQALSKVAELRFVLDCMLTSQGAGTISAEARQTIDDHLAAAASAAKGGTVWRPRNFAATVTGAAVERVISQLDAVEAELLRIAPEPYLRGELFNLLAHVQLHLGPNDPRRLRLETICRRVIGDEDRAVMEESDRGRGARSLWRGGNRAGGGADRQAPGDRAGGVRPRRDLTECDRQAIVSAVRAASSESRWRVSRLGQPGGQTPAAAQ